MSASVTTSLGWRTQSRAPYAVTAPSEVANPLGHLAPDRTRATPAHLGIFSRAARPSNHGPGYLRLVLLCLATSFARVSFTLNSTILRIKRKGTGWSSGNWTDPFALGYP